jgi:hypothetical protein
MAFSEDWSQALMGYIAENLILLRHLILNTHCFDHFTKIGISLRLESKLIV